MLRQIKATVHRDASVSARTATFAADAPAKAQNYGDGGRQQSNVISRRCAESSIQQWRNRIRFVPKQMADGGGSGKAGNVRFSSARRAAGGRYAELSIATQSGSANRTLADVRSSRSIAARAFLQDQIRANPARSA